MLSKQASLPSTACPLKNAACFRLLSLHSLTTVFIFLGPTLEFHYEWNAIWFSVVQNTLLFKQQPETSALCEQLQRYNEKVNTIWTYVMFYSSKTYSNSQLYHVCSPPAHCKHIFLNCMPYWHAIYQKGWCKHLATWQYAWRGFSVMKCVIQIQWIAVSIAQTDEKISIVLVSVIYRAGREELCTIMWPVLKMNARVAVGDQSR